MREIKFRAWDKEVGRWRGLWIFRGGHTAEQRHYDEPEILDLTNRWQFCELMQYTGLKDKNGVEVYEGDILIVRLPNGQTHPVYVDYLEDWGAFIVRLKLRNWDDYAPYDFTKTDHREVIGNIYENPELLVERR